MADEREQGMEQYHKYQWSESHEIIKNSSWTKELILSSQWELGRDREELITKYYILTLIFLWSRFVGDIKWELKPSGRHMGDYR